MYSVVSIHFFAPVPGVHVVEVCLRSLQSDLFRTNICEIRISLILIRWRDFLKITRQNF
jgi:hypothetical protein